MRLTAGISLLCLAASAVHGQSVNIEHQPIGCLVADHFPELNACFQPSSDVARARVQFRAKGTGPWYFVEMQAGGACYTGILPKPQSSIEAIEYYIDVASKGYGESRTPDYLPRIASGLGGCKRRGVIAGFATTGAVKIFAPAGAPAVPSGFSGAGVTTISGAVTGPTAAASGSPASGGSASAASKKGAEKAVKSGGGAGGGTAALAVLALGAAGAGAYYVATQEDPQKVDDDGDGLSEADGDCDDKNKDVSPNGGIDFTMDFAFSGNVGCSALNSRQQTYRVQNRSCTAVTVESLTHTLSSGGGGCLTENFSDALPLQASTVPPGATTVIRTGPGAGTARSVCCSGQRCNTGTCNISEQYTVKTSAGSKTLTNTVTLNVDSPSCLPSCDRPIYNLGGADEAEASAATLSRTMRCQ